MQHAPGIFAVDDWKRYCFPPSVVVVVAACIPYHVVDFQKCLFSLFSKGFDNRFVFLLLVVDVVVGGAGGGGEARPIEFLVF